MMSRFIIIFVCFLLVFSVAGAQEKGGVVSTGSDNTEVLGNLEDLKNPFLSSLPPPVKVEPPKKPEIKPKPKPKKVDPVVKKTPPKLNLIGMVWGEARSQAIINGAVVSEGDVISGARVLSISKKGVQLLFDEARIDLMMDK